MKKQHSALVLLLVVAACGDPAVGPATTTPTPTSSIPVTSTTEPHGDPMMLDDLVTAFDQSGADVRIDEAFTDKFLGSERAVLLCLDERVLQVYDFATRDAMLAAASTIDPDDPSHIGNAIVEWIGPVAFWQGGTFLLQYIGFDEDLHQQIGAVLDEPVAQSTRGRTGPLLTC